MGEALERRRVEHGERGHQAQLAVDAHHRVRGVLEMDVARVVGDRARQDRLQERGLARGRWSSSLSVSASARHCHETPNGTDVPDALVQRPRGRSTLGPMSSPEASGPPTSGAPAPDDAEARRRRTVRFFVVIGTAAVVAVAAILVAVAVSGPLGFGIEHLDDVRNLDARGHGQAAATGHRPEPHRRHLPDGGVQPGGGPAVGDRVQTDGEPLPGPRPGRDVARRPAGRQSARSHTPRSWRRTPRSRLSAWR